MGNMGVVYSNRFIVETLWNHERIIREIKTKR